MCIMTVKIVWKKPDKGIVPNGNEIASEFKYCLYFLVNMNNEH